jgi:hypothetical protein
MTLLIVIVMYIQNSFHCFCLHAISYFIAHYNLLLILDNIENEGKILYYIDKVMD